MWVAISPTLAILSKYVTKRWAYTQFLLKACRLNDKFRRRFFAITSTTGTCPAISNCCDFSNGVPAYRFTSSKKQRASEWFVDEDVALLASAWLKPERLSCLVLSSVCVMDCLWPRDSRLSCSFNYSCVPASTRLPRKSWGVKVFARLLIHIIHAYRCRPFR